METAVQTQTVGAADRKAKEQSSLLRQLDPRQRRVFELLTGQGTATTVELATHLGLGPRTVVSLWHRVGEGGLLIMHDPSRKNRSFRLATAFEKEL